MLSIPLDLFIRDKRAKKLARRNRRAEKRQARYQKKLVPKKETLFASPALIQLQNIPEGGSGKLLNRLGRRSAEREIDVPPVFSIIRNPEESLNTILKLAHFADYPLSRLFLNHHSVVEVDLAAESIFDFVVMELVRRNKELGRSKVRVRGRYPKNPALKRYMKAVGLIKNLKFEHEYLTIDEEKKLKIFEMRSKRAIASDVLGSLDPKEKAVKDFVDHIDGCLNVHRKRLTRRTKRTLSSYTGEIIGNAEDHSGQDDWSIVGYLDTSHPQHICEIAIFNFGKTFAATFQELPADSFTAQEIAPYLDAHRRSGFFGVGWREEDLLTLVALQGHISSKNVSHESDRGQGTVDLIEFFQKIHADCVGSNGVGAEMVIVSGGTHIFFDGTYHMGADPKGRKIIAFNDANDLSRPPDAKYIKHLGSARFPGAIISIRFPMQLAEQTELFF